MRTVLWMAGSSTGDHHNVAAWSGDCVSSSLRNTAAATPVSCAWLGVSSSEHLVWEEGEVWQPETTKMFLASSGECVSPSLHTPPPLSCLTRATAATGAMPHPRCAWRMSSATQQDPLLTFSAWICRFLAVVLLYDCWAFVIDFSQWGDFVCLQHIWHFKPALCRRQGYHLIVYLCLFYNTAMFDFCAWTTT